MGPVRGRTGKVAWLLRVFLFLSIALGFRLAAIASAQPPQDATVATGETLTEIWIRAARYGDLETVEALIKDDALDLDASYSSDSGEPALVVASAAGHTSIVRALIEAGVDSDHRSDSKKSTALMIAAYARRCSVRRTRW